MENLNYSKVPVFEDGLALPVFPFTDGKTGSSYDPKTSSIVRYCVYVESDYDMDGDGKRDLIKALVQVPRSAVEGNYKAAALFEARPYCAGVMEDGYDHMKEVQDKDYPPFDFADLDKKVPARTPSGYISAMDLSLKSSPSDWYYEDKGCEGSMVYENLDNFNYYLVRGFAVIASAGNGAYGSDGFNFVGSKYERDAFKFVVEWLHGDRVAYADREGTIATKADWCNGNVAMTGRSYAGTMPFAVATTGTEGLKTIVPVAGIADWYSQQNMQGAQRYWPKEMLNSFLAYYCSSRYSDPSVSDEEKQKIAAFHHELSLKQLKCGFDYDSDFWDDGNYTLNKDKLNCSALIVQGLNDENVSTKQFEMMYNSFLDAGMNVKAILHQGPHITPTMPNKKYGIRVNGRLYDDIVNEWISYHLYNIENKALDMPNVLVQNNNDQDVWETYDSWDTGKKAIIKSLSDSKTTIDTNWASANISAENFDERVCLDDTNMSKRYISAPLDKALTIQGTVCVNLRAALKDGNPDTDFDPENPNDVDTLTMKLGDSSISGKMDDVEINVLLCDLCDENFDSIQTVDPERNIIPVETVVAGGIENGSNLPAFDEAKFTVVNKKYKVITRAFADLCNPDAGYDPVSAKDSISLAKGEYHDYHVYLNAARYTLLPGHKLAVVIVTEDPVNCMIHKTYSIELDDASVSAVLPITEELGDMVFEK